MVLKTDCRHFPGDRPCLPNKLEGKICPDCEYYSPVDFKILIIKLDAVGDVLRTTSLLHALKDKYPGSHISWITKKKAIDIFKNNKLVDEVYSFESPDLYSRLKTEKFNLLIHPDASPASAAIASIINADVKKGYALNDKGRVIPFNNDAVEWLEMGAFDQFKKANKKTYQQILHEIAGLEYNRGEIIISLTEDEKKIRDDFYMKNNLSRFDLIIGMNTGASRRWQLKQWRFQGFRELIAALSQEKNTGILLFGGADETFRNQKLKEEFPDVIDTGSDNSLREFFAKMDIPNILITGDTLALHTAAALKKKVVCLFGPTSSTEIESYGRIEKVYPDMECLVCYKPECGYIPNCMDLISTEMVLTALRKQINSLKLPHS